MLDNLCRNTVGVLDIQVSISALNFLYLEVIQTVVREGRYGIPYPLPVYLGCECETNPTLGGYPCVQAIVVKVVPGLLRLQPSNEPFCDCFQLCVCYVSTVCPYRTITEDKAELLTIILYI